MRVLQFYAKYLTVCYSYAVQQRHELGDDKTITMFPSKLWNQLTIM